MLLKGTIMKVLLPRGFGFIQGDDGQEYFFLSTEFRQVPWSGENIFEGMRVEFSPTTDRRAKGNGKRAIGVHLL